MTCQELNYLLIFALIGSIFFGPVIAFAIRDSIKRIQGRNQRP